VVRSYDDRFVRLLEQKTQFVCGYVAVQVRGGIFDGFGKVLAHAFFWDVMSLAQQYVIERRSSLVR
jgi:hypothetical protein